MSCYGFFIATEICCSCYYCATDLRCDRYGDDAFPYDERNLACCIYRYSCFPFALCDMLCLGAIDNVAKYLMKKDESNFILTQDLNQ